MINIIGHKKIWLTISAVMVLVSIVVISLWGLKFGIDFLGGSLLEINFKNERPATTTAAENFSAFGLEHLKVQPLGEKSMILRFESVDEVRHQEILTHLRENFGEIEESRFESIGPTIGKELRQKAIYSIFIVIICIILYIALVFRKVSKPIASWKYGITAVIALAHDIIIPIAVFSVLGKFLGVEVASPFVAAMLMILGYSINDKIVVFDRVRENLIRTGDYENFEEVVNKSVNQSLTRSINTSITTLLVLLAIFFLGGQTIKDFALVLIVGVAVGTHSSLFVASPLLVVWEKWRRHR